MVLKCGGERLKTEVEYIRTLRETENMAYSKIVDGLAVAGMTDSGHMVPMDTKKDVGGHESAAAPMDLVLQALIGCTHMDVISILKKMRVEYEDFTVRESNERAEDHPKVYTKIHVTYDFKGEGMDLEKVKKAVSLSLERYCPVHAMLKETVEMSHEIKINDERID